MTQVYSNGPKGPIIGFKQLHKDDVVELHGLSEKERSIHEAPLRYNHLAEDQRHTVGNILRGRHLLDDIPKLRSRVVRLFISSTFQDMKEERDALITKTYPKLKAYCRERYGLEFQVVDLRWGIQQCQLDDHSVIDLCLEEIKNSRHHSIGPNFAVFLGQRYGYTGPPPHVVYTIYEAIRNAVKQISIDDVNFLDEWYHKDTNAIPATFVLQPVSSVLGEDTSDWPEIEKRLYKIIINGTTLAVTDGSVDPEVLRGFKESITEKEMREGIFKLGSDRAIQNNILGVVRTIDDLEDNLDKKKVGSFCDLLENTNMLDTSKHEAIMRVRDEDIVPYLKDEHLFYGSVEYSDPNGMDPRAHADYLNVFTTFFYNKTRELIDCNVRQRGELIKDELYHEVLQHWNLAKTRCNEFHGREDLLEVIAEYLVDETDQPLVIHGESGFGKTSLVSKAASEIQKWMVENGYDSSATIVIRFCGTTPASSNIRQLLRSLCHQVAFTSEKYRHRVPKDYKDIKQYFKDMVQLGEFRGMVVIFIDSLTQLSDTDKAFQLDWLPSKISKNCKIIVSTTPDENGVLEKLRSKITNERYYLEVKPMKDTLCFEIISDWLAKSSRQISFHQWRVVKEAIKACAMPLFTKLTFEEILLWKSYTPIVDNMLATTVHDCINKLFDRLERNHGSVLVSHALGYISASKAGLSETEIEDILSLDDEVLTQVFQYWKPPIRRIPPCLWARIHHDIAHYLVERENDETSVIYWYHAQFIHAARQRYLSDPEKAKYLHGVISDYYLGKWSKMVQKPFTYSMDQMQYFNIREPEDKAVRFVTEQPLVYETYNTEKRYNFRKLNQMPYHLVMADRMHDLYTEVFFNYQWIYNKIYACTIQNVISDYNLSPMKEVELVADALRMSEAAVSEDVNVLSMELAGRLVAHIKKHPFIRKLIRQCDTEAMIKCPVVPNWQAFTTPGGPLQYVCETGGTPKGELDVGIIQTDDSVLLAAKPFYAKQMRIWDITQGEPQPSIDLITGSNVYPTPDGQYVNVIQNKRSLLTYRVDSGELYGSVSFDHGDINHVDVSNRYITFTYQKSNGPVLIDTQARMLLQRFQYQSSVIAISKDQKYFVCNNGHYLNFHELPLLERKCIIPSTQLPKKIIFTKDSLKFYAMFKDRHIKSYRVNLIQKKALENAIVGDVEMQDFLLSYTERYLLVRSSRCLFVMDTLTDELMYRIQKMPEGIFVERLSTFREAGFTPDDNMIVAIRHTYIGVWDARSGDPIRLLQSSVSPVLRLFTSSLVNKVTTLQEDSSLQVWNLDNIDADVQHLNSIVQGEILYLDAAVSGNRVICCGKSHAEARTFNILNGEYERTFVHSEDVGRKLEGVQISPCGNYGITRIENQDYPDYLKPWHLLKEDKIWDLNTGRMMRGLTNNRYVVFSPDDDKVIFFPCREYSTLDWALNSYDFIVMGLSSEENFLVELPGGDVVGNPVLTPKGEYLALLLQHNDRKPGELNKPGRQKKILLTLYSFEKSWRGLKFIKLSNIWSGIEEDANFMDVHPLQFDTLLLTYGKGLTGFSHKSDGSLDRNVACEKGAFIYDIKRDCLITRLDPYLNPSSMVESLLVSKTGLFVLDSNDEVFNGLTGKYRSKITISKHAAPGSLIFVLDGKYTVLISKNRREIHVYRSNDGYRKARFFVHGQAKWLKKILNDYTVAIGCMDGRILVCSIILEDPNPMHNIIDKLPSREIPAQTNGPNPLERDVRVIQKTHNEHRQLSAVTRSKILEEKRKLPAFKRLDSSVHLNTELIKSRSVACVIQ